MQPAGRKRVGRPPGSSNGRVPVGGYPKVSERLGGFLAGFLEGEATFSNGAGGNPSVKWAVIGGQDLAKLVAVLDKFPPRGRKEREYDIWREAVDEVANRNSDSQRRLTGLRRMLVSERRYRAAARR